MRLLHTKNLRIQVFSDTEIPSYAIVSHRWAQQELTLQSFQNHRTTESTLNGVLESSLSKILKSCQLAAKRNFDWVWIDTCCIDKTSSAELSEAINSMFRWYESAGECYAYLCDVVHEQTSAGRWAASSTAAFRNSDWFKRGWTLQELLAPSQVRFYDATWSFMGTKDDIQRDLADITGVDAEYMNERRSASVAAKMSWVAQRKTSRSEDMAYCLLGLFDVNMPLLYGEGGSKAFLRLQLEILKNSDDESIFAWTSDKSASGMLANSPSDFTDCGDITLDSLSDLGARRLPYTMTNKGLEYHIPCSSYDRSLGYKAGETVELALNCWTLQEVIPVPKSIFGPVKAGALKKVMRRGKAKFVEALETSDEKFVRAQDVDLSRVKHPENIPLQSAPFCVTIKLRCHGHYWRRTECGKLELGEEVMSSVGNRGTLTNVTTVYVK